LLQVPANRIGATQFSLAQLKIMQEVITLLVFVPFAVMYMEQPMKLDFLWAGPLFDRCGLLRLSCGVNATNYASVREGRDGLRMTRSANEQLRASSTGITQAIGLA
jgi:hypothetical protein